MNRHKAREQAFKFVFESEFGINRLEDIVEMAKLYRNEEINDFSVSLFTGIKENENLIEEYIEKNVKGWKKGRLSIVSMSILKIAIYEILYIENIPASVSINEAVELAKKYGEKGEPSYINGVLGAVVRKLMEV